MKCIVTGSAGFIGSHLVERLRRDGHEVQGDPDQSSNSFALLRWLQFDPDYIFHLGAQTGLTAPWQDYLQCNVNRLCSWLHSVLRYKNLKRFIYASTSSVYGRYACGDENLPLRPISHYGVTKLAGENLCRMALEEHGLPVVILRYFSVYGPRQRTDQAYRKLIDSMQHGKSFVIYGDGQQTRGNTYVDDVVEATVRAMEAPIGETYNVGGGEQASLMDVVRMFELTHKIPARIEREPARAGDQRHTFADTSKIESHLGWEPKVWLLEGLKKQWEWQAML